jgi:ketosteroid isomerase-like protein
MKTKTLLLTLVLGLTAAAVHAAGDEQTLRDLDAQWSKAAAAKDVDKTVSYYSDDANVLPANAPIATTKEAIRTLWKSFIDSPGFSISWRTTKVEVAKSGEIGFVTGTYEFTMNDAAGNPVNDKGKYVEVFEKKGGTWKCGVDIWNSDLPAAPAEKK